jgi:hypothetical protein
MRERTIEKTAALLASSLLFAIASGCGSDEDSSDGTGGKGTGGASGATSGGTAGTASGGTAGTPSGGTGGIASGGVAGTASGGAAGTVSGGAAGTTGGGGTGGGGTDGGSTGWGCTETPTTCACSAANPSAQGACLKSYTCCYQTKQECHCLNLPSQQCAQTIKSLKASQVSTCPPP